MKKWILVTFLILLFSNKIFALKAKNEENFKVNIEILEVIGENEKILAKPQILVKENNESKVEMKSKDKDIKLSINIRKDEKNNLISKIDTELNEKYNPTLKSNDIFDKNNFCKFLSNNSGDKLYIISVNIDTLKK